MIGDGSEIYPFPAYMVLQDTCSCVRVAVIMSVVQHIEITIASHTMTVLVVDGAEVERSAAGHREARPRAQETIAEAGQETSPRCEAHRGRRRGGHCRGHRGRTAGHRGGHRDAARRGGPAEHPRHGAERDRAELRPASVITQNISDAELCGAGQSIRTACASRRASATRSRAGPSRHPHGERGRAGHQRRGAERDRAELRTARCARCARRIATSRSLRHHSPATTIDEVQQAVAAGHREGHREDHREVHQHIATPSSRQSLTPAGTGHHRGHRKAAATLPTAAGDPGAQQARVMAIVDARGDASAR